MDSKQFLQFGGGILVLLGILGLLGVTGPSADQSVFGSWWWFDNKENWAHLILGIAALIASFTLPTNPQKLLAITIGIIAVLVGLWGFINSTLFRTNLENPADNILHLIVGAWGLW